MTIKKKTPTTKMGGVVKKTSKKNIAKKITKD